MQILSEGEYYQPSCAQKNRINIGHLVTYVWAARHSERTDTTLGGNVTQALRNVIQVTIVL